MPDTTGLDGKLMTAAEAVARFVPDGAQIAVGGFTINRNPMAMVYEIARSRVTRSAPRRALQRPGSRRAHRRRLREPP